MPTIVEALKGIDTASEAEVSVASALVQLNTEIGWGYGRLRIRGISHRKGFGTFGYHPWCTQNTMYMVLSSNPTSGIEAMEDGKDKATD